MDGQLWHALTREDVMAGVEAKRHGLAAEDVRERRLVFGENQLQERAKAPLLSVFFEQFQNFMVIVLLIATLIAGLLGEFSDAITIIVIVLANAFLGFAQQVRAEQSLTSLRELTSPEARVLRAGTWQKILAAGLVPGDIVALEAGDRIPADARLLESEMLETEESSLTGESLPSGKSAVAVVDEDATLGDRKNMVYLGTMVTRGKGLAVVIATGMSTEMGRIADLIQSAEEGPTPLEQRLDELGRTLVYVSVALTIVVVFAGIIHGRAPYEMFLAGISLAVAAIPEGLPAIVTIALALGVQRMIRRKAIVRKLPSVETLGCATVICSDKTGTLTQNRMTVQEVYVGGVLSPFLEEIDSSLDALKDAGAQMDPAFERLLAIAIGCNNAHLGPEGELKGAVGDPTEIALLVMGERARYRHDAVRVREYPFDSERKRMSVLARRENAEIVYAKGAPDLLLERCSRIQIGNRVELLTDSQRIKILDNVAKMASRALRTLAFAYKPGDSLQVDANAVEQDLIFVGMVGMMDPPRPEVKMAIATCRRAGIRAVMITGDHKLTAEAIARELGILPRHGQVMTGRDLDRLSDRSLQDIVDDVYVFARVSPYHKLRIVEALRHNGHVVAMTGDGVNDAPAIKAADIGIAMGRSGTDVAKDASALVLADDNFATIVAAIEEGRGIYDNIRKFIRYLLTSNVGEIVTMFLAMAAGLPLPLLPIQILWVNLVTDGLPAIALGVDPAEDDTMARPPRSVREGIFARGLGGKILFRGFLIGLMTLAVFYGALEIGRTGLIRAQTMAFATLVLAQLIHVFDCRSVDHGILRRSIFGNKWLVAAVLSSLSLLLAVIYIPSLSLVFHTEAPRPLDWIAILAAAAIPTFAAQAGGMRGRTRIAPAPGR